MRRMRIDLHGRSAVRNFFAIATGLWLGACSSPFPPPLQEGNADQVSEVLANAYGETSSSYLGGVEPSELAIAGLSGISKRAPGFSVTDTGEVVILEAGSKEIYRFDRPADADVEGWADASAAALIAARTRMGSLEFLPRKQIYEDHIASFTRLLGEDAKYFAGRELYDYLTVGLSGYINFAYEPTSSGLQVTSLDHQGHLEAEGLRVDDVVTRIDGRRTAGLSRYEVMQLLRGPEESEVRLRLRRDGQLESTSLSITRKKPTQKSYRLDRIGSIARYEVAVVNARTAVELIASLGQELRKATYGEQPLAGVVLDLRGASGVRFFADERMINAFLGKGVILRQKGRHPNASFTTNASWPDHSQNLPLVVLIDGFTDVGAETVAAALQDSGRAILIGSSTSGSGVVYRNVSLYNMGSIAMRWAYAYAPSGYGIEGRGVMPNVCTSIEGSSLEQVLQELRRGRALTSAEDRTRDIAPGDTAALAAHRALCPPVAETGDLPHDLAMAILREPELHSRLLQPARP